MFQLRERNTTVRTELIAGVTAFMAMAYILIVNAGMFADYFGPDYFDAVYIATAISAVIGTALMGLIANLPLSQAAGMGINAFFVNTICREFGFTYANALVLVFFDGLVFILLTVTGLRKHILNAIPNCVKTAISAGIGLFIAFLGLQSAGLIVIEDGTLRLHSLNLFFHSTTNWTQVMPLLVAFAAIFAVGILAKKQVKGAVLWGIFGGAALYYLLGYLTVPNFTVGDLSLHPLEPFQKFFDLSLGAVFTEGFDFAPYIAENGLGSFVVAFATSTLAFCMVDMFDTLGALYGACACGGLLTKDGEIPNMERAMLCDAVATCTGAVCGSSPVTTFVESSAGIAEGGRTGLTALTTAACFLVAMFFAPIARLVPSCATAAALVYVGVLMMGCVRDIEWSDPAVALPAFLTVAMIPFTNNISYGIALGMICHIFIQIFTGKIKHIPFATWLISGLFAVMFFVSH